MQDGNPFYAIERELQFERPRWGGWSTLFWAYAITLATYFIEGVASAAYIGWLEQARPDQYLKLYDIWWHGGITGVAYAASVPVTLSLVVLAVRLSGVGMRVYLALKWPSWRQILAGVLLVGAITAGGDYFAPQSVYESAASVTNEFYASARDSGPMVFFLFAFAVVVSGPVVEEVTFRGFLYRGLAADLGNYFSIVLLSLIWAALHVQYETYYLVQIFILGLVLGGLRWWSGSLILTVGLHVLVNGISLAMTAADATV